VNSRDYLDLGIGEVLGLLTALIIIVVVIVRRFRTLSSIDFKLAPPPIPHIILVAIKTAEMEFYATQPFWRRAVEELQDVLSFLWPGLVYTLNFSVGRYRIKPGTIDDLIPWAIKEGYLVMHSEPNSQARALIAYFSHQPALNDWQISVYLEHLRLDHPDLRSSDWDTISADDALIAKLYSGYMGAGGDWGGWKASLTPGAEANRRFGFDRASGSYRVIEALRV